MLLVEPGGGEVQAVLGDCAMTAVNVAEVVGHYARNGVAERDIHIVLDPLRIERVDFDDDLAYAAGVLLPITRSAGLSLGDRACLALARRLGARALTTDRAWRGLAGQLGVHIDVIG
jgi:ribonuclease VapC